MMSQMAMADSTSARACCLRALSGFGWGQSARRRDVIEEAPHLPSSVTGGETRSDPEFLLVILLHETSGPTLTGFVARKRKQVNLLLTNFGSRTSCPPVLCCTSDFGPWACPLRAEVELNIDVLDLSDTSAPQQDF